MRDLILMQLVGMHPVLVHGGGPEINQLLKKLDIPSRFVNGQRVTSPAVMEVVEMALAGKLNPQIVRDINLSGGRAIGLCGSDACLLKAQKLPPVAVTEEGREVLCDLGLAGRVKEVNTGLLQLLIKEGYLPVIAPIGMGEDGQVYNVNADYAAAAVAAALKAEKFILLTDVAGVYRDYEDKSTLIGHLTSAEAEALIAEKRIDGGMIPKIECCIRAVREGAGSAHIIDGRQPHSIILEVLTEQGIGTMFEK